MSGIRGRKDGVRSVRHRSTDSSAHETGDWLATAGADATPRDPRAQARRPAAERRAAQLPGWLRALFFLPAAPTPMAHRDPYLKDMGRRMAHEEGEPGAASGLHAERTSRSRRTGFASDFSSTARRRFLAGEQRRREFAAVLGLLVVASAFSVAGPITGLGTTPDPTPIYVIAGEPAHPTASPPEDSGQTMLPVGTLALDPTYLPPPTPQPSKATPKPVRARPFVALGDSLTAWPSDNPWPNRLDAVDAALRLVSNAAVPGNTTSQMRARLATDVYPYKPEVLFVLGGTNDLGYGISQSAIIANLRAIIVAAKAHKIRVILITVPPDSYTNMAPKIKSLNTAILNLASSQRINAVDIFGVLANGDGVFQPRFTSDGLHFSDLGCQTVTNTIRSRIRRLGL